MAKSREQKRMERKQQKAKMRAQQYAEAAARKKQKGGHKVVGKRPVKVNGYANDGFGKVRVPEVRAHSGHFGTKEKVKKGIITPCEGLAVVPNNTKTGAWLENQKKKIGCK